MQHNSDYNPGRVSHGTPQEKIEDALDYLNQSMYRIARIADALNTLGMPAGEDLRDVLISLETVRKDIPRALAEEQTNRLHESQRNAGEALGTVLGALTKEMEEDRGKQ